MNSPPRLKLIDFHETLSQTSSDNVDRVFPALENDGCFMAKYDKLEGCHKTLKNKLPDLFIASREKFSLLQNTISDFAYTTNDQYESFDIPVATTEEGIDKFITTIWREGNNDMRKAILAYTRTAADLGEKVTEIVLKHNNLDKKSTGYIFRMMKYKRGEVNLGFSNQNDRVEFLAVLFLNQVDGLKMKYNNEWVKIDVKPSTFLIMAGKQLEDWTGGKIHPPELRVKMDENKERYSVGLFSYYDKGKTDEGKSDKGKNDKGKKI